MVDFYDPKNYKKCSVKQWDGYFSMPPHDTVVINKLDYPEVVAQLGGKCYFTVAELEEFKTSNTNMLNTIKALVNQGIAKVVTGKLSPVVLCGALGELSTLTLVTLGKCFVNASGEAIDVQSLMQKARIKSGAMDWHPVRCVHEIPSSLSGKDKMACFVPAEQICKIQTKSGVVIVNKQGVSHGYGDFIVCKAGSNGEPMLETSTVVNGELFALTYNNQGWGNCLEKVSQKSDITIDSLPQWFDDTKSIGVDEKNFRAKCSGLIKQICDRYQCEFFSDNFEKVDNYKGTKGTSLVARYLLKSQFCYSPSNSVRRELGISTSSVSYTTLEVEIILGKDDIATVIVHPKDANYNISRKTLVPHYREDWADKVGFSKLDEATLFKYFKNSEVSRLFNRVTTSGIVDSGMRFLSNYMHGAVSKLEGRTDRGNNLVQETKIVDVQQSSVSNLHIPNAGVSVGADVSSVYEHLLTNDNNRDELVQELSSNNFTSDAGKFIKSAYDFWCNKGCNVKNWSLLDFYESVILKMTHSNEVVLSIVKDAGVVKNAVYVQYVGFGFTNKQTHKLSCFICKLSCSWGATLSKPYDFILVDAISIKSGSADIQFEQDKMSSCVAVMTDGAYDSVKSKCKGIDLLAQTWKRYKDEDDGVHSNLWLALHDEEFIRQCSYVGFLNESEMETTK